jgi:hypothetical protein
VLKFEKKNSVAKGLIQLPFYAIRNKLRRFYSFACRPPGLERLSASSRLSVRLYTWTEFHENWYLNVFRTSARIIQISHKSDKKKALWHEELRINLTNSLSSFLLYKKIFRRKFVEKLKTQLLWRKSLFRKSWRLRDNVKNIVAYFKVWLGAKEPPD